jgi:hypothetical protein
MSNTSSLFYYIKKQRLRKTMGEVIKVYDRGVRELGFEPLVRRGGHRCKLSRACHLSQRIKWR